LRGFQKAKTKGSLFLKFYKKNPELQVPEFPKFQKKNGTGGSLISKYLKKQSQRFLTNNQITAYTGYYSQGRYTIK
jgi:hypothetical protein